MHTFLVILAVVASVIVGLGLLSAVAFILPWLLWDGH